MDYGTRLRYTSSSVISFYCFYFDISFLSLICTDSVWLEEVNGYDASFVEYIPSLFLSMMIVRFVMILQGIITGDNTR